MDLKKKYRLRVESCIGTVIDVHKNTSYIYEHKEFLSYFEKLKRAIHKMDMTKVSEQDVVLVEQATNDLLGEFRSIFKTGDYGPVYEKLKH